ncbi:MAG: RMD1 family protein [Gammaproteobacteria bacterium]|nr:RMD1 family protein [Gammaproteobacteria bacterium]
MLQFNNDETLIVRAHHIADRLRIRSSELGEVVADYPLTIQVNNHGYVILFRYGSVVFFNLDIDEEKDLLEKIGAFSRANLDEPEAEQQLVTIDPNRAEGMYQDALNLKSFDLEQMQILAEILAKSVALAYYERLVADVINRVEPLATNLQQKGRSGVNSKALLKQVGASLAVEHKMLGRVEVNEKPELLWDRPDLERNYLRLEDEYELQERHTALEQKLNLITRTAETLLELMRHRSTHRVEWYITILIIIEIIITLSNLH